MKKRVTILGLGETGLASALFLSRKGHAVFVSDAQTSEALEARAARLRAEGIPCELGGHALEKIADCDWVLMSPGISPASPVYRALKQKEIPMVSELEAASWFSRGKVTAVTGTTGKTTVTTLLQRIYEANGLPSVLCGNIGNPWIGELEHFTSATEVVLEVSSFQLVHTYSLRPHFGVLLNIGLNHLDWHPDMGDYVASKLRLFQNQTPEDFAFLQRADQERLFPGFSFGAKTVYFPEGEGGNLNEKLLYAVTQVRGLDPAKTGEVLAQFRGIEHRLEKVAEVEGIEFVNDSKCTSLEALVWGLEKYPDKKVILLAGGHAKGADFRTVRAWISKKVKRGVLYGEAKDLLWESWKGAAPLLRADDLADAFKEARKIAKPGDVILLSPACASFDQFPNYKERGKLFKQLVASSGAPVSAGF
jgi:UDP-N-acetylmuramoylalanine--D-glutamate ligase